MLLVSSTDKNSMARKLGIKKGDRIVSFNGEIAEDMLDVAYYDCEESFVLSVDRDGSIIDFEVQKSADDVMGYNFTDDSYIEPRHCANKCIFCFVDQLPAGMRDTLYIKDDDWRLSFVSGNYVTLTNLSQHDIDRIVKRKYSPLFVSVHATDDNVRRYLLGNKTAPSILPLLRRFADAGITMETQVVMCPGVNDGEVLRKTLADLYSLYPAVSTVAVVPVGVTSHRKGLSAVNAVTSEIAMATISCVEQFDKICFEQNGEHFAYCSDEMYIYANKQFPPYDFYGNFAQIENGVGLVADFKYKFQTALLQAKRARKCSFTVVSGVSAGEVVTESINQLKQRFPTAKVNVLTVENKFFGSSVSVSGLLVGKDIIDALNTSECIGDVIILPRVMLRERENVFLDGTTLGDFKKAIKKKVIITCDGEELCRTIVE